MRSRRASPLRLAVLFPVLGAVALWAACGKKAASDDEGDDASANLVAEVTVTKVARADISANLTVTGTIAALPNRDVKVSSLVPGRVAKVMVAEGDRVKTNDILAHIEDRPFRDQIQQAASAVAQAKANLENSRLSLQRNETLFKRGIAAQKDVEDARTMVSVNLAAQRQAEAGLSLARLSLQRADVRSPLDGIVVKRLVSTGEQVDGTAAQPICEVADTSEVELYGNVPATYLSRIRVGQDLQITTDALPGKEFRGKVVAISPAVDPTTNVGLVRIRMANPTGMLRLGIFLSAQIPLETHHGALVVPSQAIYRDADGHPEVYEVKGDASVATPVQMGLQTQEQAELLSGVKEGDVVVLSGGYGLPEHAKIKVKP